MAASEEGNNTGGYNNRDLSVLLYMLQECFRVFFSMFIYILERESIDRGEAEREGDRGSKVDSMLIADSPVLDLNS